MRGRKASLFTALAALAASASLRAAGPSDFRTWLPEDEIIYFPLPDRFDTSAPGSIAMSLPPLSYSICAARSAFPQ